MRWLLFAFIVVPILELSILIYSGQEFGFLPTILIIMVTGIVGAFLAKKQGAKAWIEFNQKLARREAPGNALIDAICIFFGGILLIVPGFITDIVGFLLLFNGPRKLIRPLIIRWIYQKIKNQRVIIR